MSNYLSNTFNQAFIGISKNVTKLNNNFYGSYDEFKAICNEINLKNIPVVLYMHGSSGLGTGERYRKWIVENTNFIFFAPNSFALKNRPVYRSPDKIKKYNKVHKLRHKELEYNLKKIKKINFTDNNNIFLMGNSEGAVTSSMYNKYVFKGRIITAFSCENCYFINDYKIGAKKYEPILNIIGNEDEYFSNKSNFNINYNVDGNSLKTLENHKNAKIVILPKAKHDLTSNIYTKYEILNFLKIWYNNS